MARTIQMGTRRLSCGSAGWMGATLIALIASALVLASASTVRAQDDPEPEAPPGCDPLFSRSVMPDTVWVDESVDVDLMFDPSCTPFEEIGIDVMFVVDRSIRMRSDKYFEPTRVALGDFVIAMNMETSSAGLITYARNDSISRNLTSNRDDLIRAINSIRLTEEDDTRGLLGALRTATEKLNSGTEGNEKVVMIVVAGSESSQPLVNMPTVTNAARNAGVRFVFLMFPDARFQHFVDSASECHSGCPRWSGPRAGDPIQMKWAWGVDREGPNGIENVMDTLVEKLLREITVTSIEFWESFEDDVVFDESSASPAASRVDFGADAFWTYSDVPPGGRRITYKAKMQREGATYPVTLKSEVTVGYSDGFRNTYQLPNPPVTVREGAPPSPTPTETPVPATATSDVPTETPPPPTDTPMPTAETPELSPIYMPVAYRQSD